MINCELLILKTQPLFFFFFFSRNKFVTIFHIYILNKGINYFFLFLKYNGSWLELLILKTNIIEIAYIACNVIMTLPELLVTSIPLTTYLTHSESRMKRIFSLFLSLSLCTHTSHRFLHRLLNPLKPKRRRGERSVIIKALRER